MKLNYIKNDTIEKIIIFSGQKEHYRELLNKNPLSEELLQFWNEEEYEKIKNKPIEFVDYQIHNDDTIEEIKKKIIIAFNKEISYEEIYIFGTFSYKKDLPTLFNELTNNLREELTNPILNSFLTNLGQKFEGKKEVFQLHDLGFIKSISKIKKPIGQKFNKNPYKFTANPYKNQIWKIDKNEISTMQKDLLFNNGHLLNGEINLILARDILPLIDEVKECIEIYYPFIFKKEIESLTSFEKNLPSLVKESNSLISKAFVQKIQSIDLMYSFNKFDTRLKIQPDGEGISEIKIKINQPTKINLPIEVLFKLINTSEQFPIIRLNEGVKKEKLCKLFSKEITNKGEKVPYINRASYVKYLKIMTSGKNISVICIGKLEEKKIPILCEISNKGIIEISFQANNIYTIKQIEDLFITYANPVLTIIKQFISESGYNLQIFSSLYDNNVEILNANYILTVSLEKALRLNKNIGCISQIVNIIANNPKTGYVMRYKKVSNYNEMNAINSYIVDLLNENYTGETIIYYIQENFNMTKTEAQEAFTQIIRELNLEAQLYENRQLRVKDSPGFPSFIKLDSFSNNITFEINKINNIQYIPSISIYMKAILLLGQQLIENEHITNLCKKELKTDENKIVDIEVEEIEDDELEFMDDIFDIEEMEEEEEDEEESEQIGGNEIMEERIENMPLTNPNYFFNKMYSKDPVLFLKKKQGNYNAYSRMCPSNVRRQPVLLTNEEKENIDKKYPNSYDEAIHYGSSKNKQFWYICPRYWCLKNNTSLSQEDVDRGECGGKEAIIPNDAKKVPKGKFIYEFSADSEHKDGNGKYIQHYPGFITGKNHPDNKCMPCCFKSWDSPEQLKRRKECLNPDVENKDNQKEEDLDEYIKGPDKFPIQKGKYGFLPIPIQQFFQLDSNECKKTKNKNDIKPEITCEIRKGVEISNKQSFLGCISDLYGDYSGETLSISQMREKIGDLITLDLYVTLQNGDLIQIFSNTDQKVNLEKYENTKLFKKTKNKLLLKQVIRSYENFQSFIRDPNSIIDYTYLWDFVCNNKSPLFEQKPINLVILEISTQDNTNNVELICPTNYYSNMFKNDNHWDRKGCYILIKKNEYFEPIVSYYDKSSKKNEKKIKITKLFNIRSNANPEIKSTLTRLFTYFQSYCIPFPSISPTIYKYKENHNLFVLTNEVRKIKASILKYVLNYDIKVVGIICEINNQKGYLPCFPSNVIDEDMPTKFLDEIDLWNSYSETIQFLKMIKKKNKNILCSPVGKVEEDGLTIGLLTETNQFIGINKPEENVNDGLLVLHKGNYILSDVKSILGKNKDTERKKLIQNIYLEKNFFTSFRNTMRILLNQYSYISQKEDILKIINNSSILYFDKLQKIIIMLMEILNSYVEFVPFDDELLESLQAVQTCYFDCKKPFCMKSKENDNCILLIPDTNLFNGKSNKEIYYGRLADELIRFSRIQSYIFEPNVFLSFSKINYKLRDDEIIMDQNILTKEYFEYIDSQPKLQGNLKTTYDTAEPYKSLPYSSFIEKCIVVKNKTVSGVFKNIFPDQTREHIYTYNSLCSYSLMQFIIQKYLDIPNVSISEIKEKLLKMYEEYNKNIEKYYSKSIIEIQKQIISDFYILNELDIWFLCIFYKIPLLLFKFNKLKNEFQIKKVKHGEKYVFIEHVNIGNSYKLFLRENNILFPEDLIEKINEKKTIYSDPVDFFENKPNI